MAERPQVERFEGLPALHPTRVRETLRSLSEWLADPVDCCELTDLECKTCLAALKLIGKTQEATGLTTDVVDVGSAAMKLLGTLSRLRK